MHVALDAAGNLYIADHAAGVIAKVTPAGALSIIAGGGGTSGPFDTPTPATDLSIDPWSVAVDSKGNLYVADYSGCFVTKIDTTGTATNLTGTSSAISSGTFVNGSGTEIQAITLGWVRSLPCTTTSISPDTPVSFCRVLMSRSARVPLTNRPFAPGRASSCLVSSRHRLEWTTRQRGNGWRVSKGLASASG